MVRVWHQLTFTTDTVTQRVRIRHTSRVVVRLSGRLYVVYADLIGLAMPFAVQRFH